MLKYILILVTTKTNLNQDKILSVSLMSEIDNLEPIHRKGYEPLFTTEIIKNR